MTTKLLMTNRTSILAFPALLLWLFLLSPAQSTELTERIQVCVGCHGDNGLPTQANIPIIAGQHYYYLYVQLKDYKAGRRDSEFMTDIVQDLSKEDMKTLAQHFSEQSWPKNGFRADDTDTAIAQSAATSGMCVQCHLGGYEGNSSVPRLAGQQAAYLERTMLEYKNKIRMNAQAKGSLFATYDDEDIGALARYLSGR